MLAHADAETHHIGGAVMPVILSTYIVGLFFPHHQYLDCVGGAGWFVLCGQDDDDDNGVSHDWETTAIMIHA